MNMLPGVSFVIIGYASFFIPANQARLQGGYKGLREAIRGSRLAGMKKEAYPDKTARYNSNYTEG